VWTFFHAAGSLSLRWAPRPIARAKNGNAYFARMTPQRVDLHSLRLLCTVGPTATVSLEFFLQHRIALVGLASLLWVGEAAAQDVPLAPAQPDVSLLLDVPPEEACSSALSLSAEVTQRVGTPVFAGPERESRQLIVRVTHGPFGYRGSLVLVDAAGRVTAERVLEEGAAQCEDMVRALGLVLATFFGLHAGELSATEPADQDTATPAEPPRTAEPKPAVRMPSRRWPRRLAISLGALMGRGLLPRPAPALSAAITVANDAWSGSVGPLIFPHGGKELGAGASASFSAWLLRAQLCATLANLRRLRISACGGGRAGLLFSESSGLAHTKRARIVTGEVEAGIRLAGEPRWLGGRTGLYGGLGATFPLRPPRFVFTESGAAEREYHRAKWGVWAELGVLLQVGS